MREVEFFCAVAPCESAVSSRELTLPEHWFAHLISGSRGRLLWSSWAMGGDCCCIDPRQERGPRRCAMVPRPWLVPLSFCLIPPSSANANHTSIVSACPSAVTWLNKLLSLVAIMCSTKIAARRPGSLTRMIKREGWVWGQLCSVGKIPRIYQLVFRDQPAQYSIESF